MLLPVTTTAMEEAMEFKEYMNSFYGVGGVYPMRNVTLNEVVAAIKKIKDDGGEFCGDSVDRERARDIIFTEEEMAKGYAKDPLKSDLVSFQ